MYMLIIYVYYVVCNLIFSGIIEFTQAIFIFIIINPKDQDDCLKQL